MNWGNLFFKFDGRINRAKFWIAALVYAVANTALTLGGSVADQRGVFQAISGMLSIVFLISALAVGIKRLHDRGKSGWYLLLFYVAPTILVVAAVMIGLLPDGSSALVAVLGFMAVAISIWAFVELGCLRGVAGPNRYGPDPLALTATPPARPPA